MRRQKPKGMYVIKAKTEKLKKFEPKKKTDTRGVYVLRTSEEVVNKFGDHVYEFVDNGGVFVLVTADKVFYQTFKRAIVLDLRIEPEFIQRINSPDIVMGKLDSLIKHGLSPFVFLDQATDGRPNTQLLTVIKAAFKDIPVVVLTREVDKDHLLHFYEEGADHVLNKSASVNEIIRKIVHIIKPATEIDELVRAGQSLVADNRFEDAIKVATAILSKRPKSPRAHIIMGDARKGMAERAAAMQEYLLAERNSKTFIEPLKRIFTMYAEDKNEDGMLEYLIKLDTLSPLNFNRKVKIGDMKFRRGDVDEAELYYDKAITKAMSEAKSVVGEMSLDIAERMAESNPEMAAKYFRRSLELVKEAGNLSHMNTFNRLGISLRKQGMWQEAVEAYEVAEKASPGDENIQYNMGLALHEGVQFKEAAQKMFLALRINPDLYKGNVEVAYNIGSVFFSSGDKAQAVKLLKHVLDLNPNHERAKKLLESK